MRAERKGRVRSLSRQIPFRARSGPSIQILAPPRASVNAGNQAFGPFGVLSIRLSKALEEHLLFNGNAKSVGNKRKDNNDRESQPIERQTRQPNKRQHRSSVGRVPYKAIGTILNHALPLLNSDVHSEKLSKMDIRQPEAMRIQTTRRVPRSLCCFGSPERLRASK